MPAAYPRAAPRARPRIAKCATMRAVRPIPLPPAVRRLRARVRAHAVVDGPAELEAGRGIDALAVAEHLAAHAAGVTNSAPPPAEAMRQLSALIVGSPVLGPKEVIDLDAMLVTISEAEGVPTRDQLALLQVYRDKAGLKT